MGILSKYAGTLLCRQVSIAERVGGVEIDTKRGRENEIWEERMKREQTALAFNQA